LTEAEFRQLFDTHFDEIRNYIWYRCGDGDLASDVTQETFVRLWEKRPYHDKSKLRGLLFKMAGDIFITHHRKKNSDLKFRTSLKQHIENKTPEEELQYQELKTKYEQALSAMPEKQRIVFLMSRYDKKKYKEIAEATGLGMKAIEKRMSLALQFIREKIQ